MRVGIDAAPAYRYRGRGAGTVCRGLIEHLLASPGAPEITLFALAPQAADFPDGRRGGARVEVREEEGAGAFRGWLADQWRLSRQLRRARPDLFHATFHWHIPPRSPAPVVAHVLDLMPLVDAPIYLERYRLPVRRKLFLYRLYLGFALSRVRRAIVPSERTRRDLASLFRFPEERIDVVPLAPGDGFRPGEDPEGLAELRHRLGLPERYFLYVGGLTWRKNLDGLVRAYGRAAAGGLEAPLLLVGEAEGAYGAMLRGLLKETGLEGQVRLLGRIPDPALPRLYAGSLALVYPSLYEGFGLPVLEAMASGAPVLCSGRGALSEVAGGAAYEVDPEDEGEMARALLDLEREEALRGELRRRGLARAAEFSWSRAVEGTLASYRRALG